MTVASSGEPIFTKVSSDAKITFNGTECTRSNQPRTISAGLYLAVDEVSNGTRTGGAQAGDIISIKGIWTYTADNKEYNFGDVSFQWNGSNWEEYVAAVAPTDVTFGIHGGHVGNKDLLLLTVEGMTVASSGEPIFTKVSSDAKITFNGTECTRSNQPRTISAGLYLAVDEVSNGTRIGGAKTGDIISLKGIWTYAADNKDYNFGDVAFQWNGGAWEEYDPTVVEDPMDEAQATIYDLYELESISQKTITADALFNLTDLKLSTNVGLRLQVLDGISQDVIFTLSKNVANNVWADSGYQIKLAPESGEIRIITEADTIQAIAKNIDYCDTFELEFAVVDMYKQGTAEVVARRIYAKMNGTEVVSWLDKDLDRTLGRYSPAWSKDGVTVESVTHKGYELVSKTPYIQDISDLMDGEEVLTYKDRDYTRKLGTYVTAWAAQKGTVILNSLTTTGYVPVEKNVGVKDFFDVSGYANTKLVPNECVSLGEMKGKNSAVKMRVDVTKSTDEFKIGIGKTDPTTLWEAEKSGYQFWFRPASGQIFISYGMDDYATLVGYSFPKQSFILEVGSKDVYYENGKHYGYQVYIKIDGEVVTSWIDEDASGRKMGKYVVGYASANADVTLSTLYSTYELPVVYKVNGDPKNETRFATAQSTVVLGKSSKVTVTVNVDPDYAVQYQGVTLGEKELKEVKMANAPSRVYTYEAKAKSGQKLFVHLETKKLTTDEPEQIVDFFDVAKKGSVLVENGKDTPIGSMVDEEGRNRANTAMRMKVSIPAALNQIRWSMYSDAYHMWGYNGFIVRLTNNKISICYPASEGTLAEGNCLLVKGNATIYVESGVVKCYEEGHYKYDRFYVKAGESLDSMELVTWHEFEVREKPETIYLRVEDCGAKTVTLNGTPLTETVPCDIEKHILAYDIAPFVQEGLNEYCVKVNWHESEDVYYALFGENVTESLKNCIVYDSEVEPIYVAGNFGVYPVGGYFEDDDKRYAGADEFYVGKAPLKISEPVKEGLPFLAGGVALKQTVKLDTADTLLKVKGFYHLAEVQVNGQVAGKLMFDKELDISDYAKAGDNKIEVRFVLGNFNLMGPQHHIAHRDNGVSVDMFELNGLWNGPECEMFHKWYDLRKLY